MILRKSESGVFARVSFYCNVKPLIVYTNLSISISIFWWIIDENI